MEILRTLGIVLTALVLSSAGLCVECSDCCEGEEEDGYPTETCIAGLTCCSREAPCEPRGIFPVCAVYHDFEASFVDDNVAIVRVSGITAVELGDDWLPVAGLPAEITGVHDLRDWYHDSNRSVRHDSGNSIVFQRVSDGNWLLEARRVDGSTGPVSQPWSEFFPLDGLGSNPSGDYGGHNFYFTLEFAIPYAIPASLNASCSPSIHIRSDDDLFAFVDGVLVLDDGGIHPVESSDVVAALPGLPGSVHSIKVFYAERHIVASALYVELYCVELPAACADHGWACGGARCVELGREGSACRIDADCGLPHCGGMCSNRMACVDRECVVVGPPDCCEGIADGELCFGGICMTGICVPCAGADNVTGECPACHALSLSLEGICTCNQDPDLTTCDQNGVCLNGHCEQITPECHNATTDCVLWPCYAASCTGLENPHCVYAFACAGSDVPGRCVNSTCVPCVDPVTDCSGNACGWWYCAANGTCAIHPTCDQAHCDPDGFCLECLADGECEQFQCADPNRCVDNACEVLVNFRCASLDMCVNNTCVECNWEIPLVFSNECPSANNCEYSYCGLNYTCISEPLCPGGCDGDGNCPCQLDTDCTATNCTTAACVDGACVLSAACDYCVAGKCAECTILDPGSCPPGPARCGYSYCSWENRCVNVTLCDDAHCTVGDQCSGCVVDGDCITPNCSTSPAVCVNGVCQTSEWCEGCYGDTCATCVFDFTCPPPPCAAYGHCVDGVCTGDAMCGPDRCMNGTCICLNAGDCTDGPPCSWAECSDDTHACVWHPICSPERCRENNTCGCSNNTQCSAPACSNVTCSGDGSCVVAWHCNSSHCVHDACVECIADGECTTAEPCSHASCVDNSCAVIEECPGFCGDGHCRECWVPSDCTDVPALCGWANCTTGGTCVYGTYCDPDHCLEGQGCLACIEDAECHTNVTCQTAHCDLDTYTCYNSPVPDDDACPGGGVCHSGACVHGCTGDANCTGGTACLIASCNATTHACQLVPLPDGTPTWGVYHCLDGHNVACIDDDYCAALPCNTAHCNASHECAYTPLSDGLACDRGYCLSGACAPNCTTDDNCTGSTECLTVSCNATSMCTLIPLPDGTPTWGVYHCLDGHNVECIYDYYCATRPCNIVHCNASHECAYTALSDGVGCEGGTCHSGVCILNCTTDDNCTESTECLTPSCNATTHMCQLTPVSDGTACVDGVCHSGACVQCINATQCELPLLCNAAQCNASHECTYVPLTDGDPCGDALHCLAGECVGCSDDSQCSQLANHCTNYTCSPENHTCTPFPACPNHCHEGQCQLCVDPLVDCIHVPCYVMGCTGDTHMCVIVEGCADGHCLGNETCIDGNCTGVDVCVDCIYPDLDCEVGPCEVASCSPDTHECVVTQCSVSQCPDNVTCTACVDPDDDCHGEPCQVYGCTQERTCELLYDCPTGHCHSNDPTCAYCLAHTPCDPTNVTCLEVCPPDNSDDHCGYACIPCVIPLTDCFQIPCFTSVCTVDHLCSYVDRCSVGQECTANGTCVSCPNGVCVQCANATRDCESRECHSAQCSGDGQCEWNVDTDLQCALPGRPPDSGYCALDGECHACTTDEQCVEAGCTGRCTSGECWYECGNGCVHAIGWWYRHANTAFPPFAPFTFAGGSITIADSAGVKDVLRGAYTPNALGILEAMLLVAKLNVAMGSSQITAVTSSMATADAILAVCPPSAWPSMLSTGICHGYHITALPPLITILLKYSDGRLGIPLCTDIGINL